jgi:hypothetical protein
MPHRPFIYKDNAEFRGEVGVKEEVKGRKSHGVKDVG